MKQLKQVTQSKKDQVKSNKTTSENVYNMGPPCVPIQTEYFSPQQCLLVRNNGVFFADDFLPKYPDDFVT